MKGSGFSSSFLRDILATSLELWCPNFRESLLVYFLRVENVLRGTTEQVDTSGSYNVAVGKMCAHAFVEERASPLACYVTRSTTVTSL